MRRRDAGSDPAEDVDLDGRVLVGVSNTGTGEVGSRTTFTYHEEGDVVWAEYRGGEVLRGYLVGTRSGVELQFRYVHLGSDGRTSSGVCDSVIEVLADGRVRFRETWQWESRAGSGVSVVEETFRSDR
ncbi:hypothetical protein [Dietzia sp. B32]|uniref:hypothetical protein n=1 Tax=Dietzia sp. B32 TaxID=2915130 RepID=UPI0021ADDA7C|nr:hypothetical protein [Dietzia sp. B32]UVE94327.1 hypothetical protein L8M95_12315 [Dietzia sp. B32]